MTTGMLLHSTHNTHVCQPDEPLQCTTSKSRQATSLFPLQCACCLHPHLMFALFIIILSRTAHARCSHYVHSAAVVGPLQLQLPVASTAPASQTASACAPPPTSSTLSALSAVPTTSHAIGSSSAHARGVGPLSLSTSAHTLRGASSPAGRVLELEDTAEQSSRVRAPHSFVLLPSLVSTYIHLTPSLTTCAAEEGRRPAAVHTSCAAARGSKHAACRHCTSPCPTPCMTSPSLFLIYHTRNRTRSRMSGCRSSHRALLKGFLTLISVVTSSFPPPPPLLLTHADVDPMDTTEHVEPHVATPAAAPRSQDKQRSRTRRAVLQMTCKSASSRTGDNPLCVIRTCADGDVSTRPPPTPGPNILQSANTPLTSTRSGHTEATRATNAATTTVTTAVAAPSATTCAPNTPATPTAAAQPTGSIPTAGRGYALTRASASAATPT